MAIRCRTGSLISNRSAVRGPISVISVCRITASTTSYFSRKWRSSRLRSSWISGQQVAVKSFGGIFMKRRVSRRAFLQGSAAAAAGGLLISKTVLLEAQPLPRAVAPSDRVRFGMIGIGMQGSGLLAGAITLPGVECVAAADLYAGRHTRSEEHTSELQS